MTDVFDLETLQKWMQGALQEPATVTLEQAQTLMAANARMSASERLGIYQRSYYLRITACMRDQFPALCHALGAQLFNQFVAEYIHFYPPESYTLYDLGRRFSGFLDETRPDKGSAAPEIWVDFMIDLARFERLLFSTFDSARAPENVIAQPATPDARLGIQRNVSIRRYQFNVAGYYHAVRANSDPELPEPEVCFLAIVRKGDITNTLPLHPEHAQMLMAMSRGADVEKALSEVAKWSSRTLDEVRQGWTQATELRASWIAAGVFVDRAAVLAHSP